jgi:phage terminase large subunit-like protein
VGKRGPGAKPPRAKKPVLGPFLPSKLRKRADSRAKAVVAFLESLTITSGSLAGTKFKLRAWQREAIARIYGIDGQGHRQVRSAVISMGRKGGKSTFAAGLALCHLIGPEARPRGQVVSAAADRGQAGLIYAELQAFALADPRFADRLIFRSHNKTAECVLTGSTFAALSSDAAKAHGLSPTVAIADEVAQWRGRELLDALRTGQGAHDEPLLLAISTRSPDPANPLEEMLSYADDVAAGIIADPTFAAFVYSAPLDADPFAESTWRLANPDMTPARLADIAAQVTQARRLPSTMPAFRAFVLNQPTASDARFIAPQDWDSCGGEAEARGPCFGGLDLAGGAADLCAFSLFWPETKLLRAWAFMPQGRIAESELSDRAPYAAWAGAGHVIITPGRAIDRAWLGQWMAEATEGLELVSIAADRWMLADLVQQMDREGLSLPIAPHGQGFKDMSPAVGALERLVLDARLRHGGNALLRWSVANAGIEGDAAGNRKVSKLRSRGRVDPLIAAIMAIGIAEAQPAPPDYSRTGLLIG